MASVVNRPNGHKWIQFAGVDGKRQTLRLGKVSRQHAMDVRERIERLLAARLMQLPVDADTARWVAGLPPKLTQRIAKFDLIEGLLIVTVETLVKDFAASLSVAPSTRQNIAVILENLTTFFGPHHNLRRIDPTDAKLLRKWMLEHGGQNAAPLARTTVSRRLRRARQIFKHAVDRGWLDRNPLAELRGWDETNREKDFFVSREIITAILGEVTNLEMRAIIALARFGGLRCPSEVIRLKWADVNWDRQTLTVMAPKTSTVRFVPLFPELEEALSPLWTQAKEWEPRLIVDHQISGSGLKGK
ncbi:hypothetical protein LCGC14_2915570, partial [marine sediment metagenome]